MADEVKVGQVWKDCDKRMGNRFLFVLKLEDGKAVCSLCDVLGAVTTQRQTRISVKRMIPGATGYRLLREAR